MQVTVRLFFISVFPGSSYLSHLDPNNLRVPYSQSPSALRILRHLSYSYEAKRNFYFRELYNNAQFRELYNNVQFRELYNNVQFRELHNNAQFRELYNNGQFCSLQMGKLLDFYVFIFTCIRYRLRFSNSNKENFKNCRLSITRKHLYGFYVSCNCELFRYTLSAK